ncbi:hypothetical protein BGW38_004240 [Lunasporangiospora selenospora]|uniref:Uncharacterized protein n=1 Tax=Lunasporangiospora selenospora TaxID=979761 RepID=A0A9P6FQF5_9FUNG|nr:hypothetical protein BGW38_004240 [Lunasporangiospora selenospora]
MIPPAAAIALGVVGVVAISVVIYAVLKDDIHTIVDSIHRQPIPVRARRSDDDDDGESEDEKGSRTGRSSTYRSPRADNSELRQRRGSDNEKSDSNESFMETQRRRYAEEAARLQERERLLEEREENLRRLMHDFEASQRNQRQQPDMSRNPFAEYEQMIRPSQDILSFASSDNSLRPRTPLSPPQRPLSPPQPAQQPTPPPVVEMRSRSSSSASTGIDSRAANAILRHNLSNNHQENVNPFEDPASLLTSSISSSPSLDHSGDTDDFADVEDRSSVTVGREDEDWTEAEIGSIGSHDSDDSWGSP